MVMVMVMVRVRVMVWVWVWGWVWVWVWVWVGDGVGDGVGVGVRVLLHDDRRPVASHPSEHAEEGLARLALVGAQLLALGVHVGEVDARGAWLGFRLGLS